MSVIAEVTRVGTKSQLRFNTALEKCFALLIAALLTSLTAAVSFAQTHDHAVVPATANADPHAQHTLVDDAQPVAAGDVDHAQHTEATGDMSINSGNDATTQRRDPHAYSNGLQRGSGPYALAGHGLHMADEMNFGGFRMNRLENLFQEGADAAVYDVQAWFGTSYNQLVVKAEGEFSDDKLEETDTDILWSHAVLGFWNTQVGVRHQTGPESDQDWLAFGMQGIAPYWFEVDVTAYLGSSGRSALNIEVDYELLITQRLILQPRVELNFYGKDDHARGLGRGLSDSSAGLRLKYQINRQLVPYIGVEQARLYGDTARFSSGSESDSETRWLAGLRFWF